MISRFFLITLILLAIAWLVDTAVDDAVGRFVATHFGSTLSHLGASKVPSAAEFVSTRIRESLRLIFITWLAGAVMHALCLRLARHHHRGIQPWAIGLVLFLILNIWCLLAGQTALFWLILRGTTAENQAQFRAKENLLREIKIHPLLALVGSSQSQAQFTEEIFNSSVAGKAWMVELHFPGSQAADVYFIGERWSGRKINGFVYYMSPGSIYPPRDSSIARDLLRLRDLPPSFSLGAWSHFSSVTVRYALLGMICPLFQDRSAFQHALLGAAALEKREQKTSPPVSIPTDPTQGYTLSAGSDFQKKAFRYFVEHSAAKGQFVIVIVGQLNPDFEAKLSPTIRADFESFLKDCAATHSNLTLVRQNELLIQNPDAYRDRDHVTEETADKFTAAFARWYIQWSTLNHSSSQ